MSSAVARAATAFVTAALVLGLALPAPAASQCPGGAPGAGQVTGFSPLFGSEAVPSGTHGQRYVDMVPAWKKYGAVTSLALFYSHTDGCLVGVRTTYGDDASSTQNLGATDGVPVAQLEMGPMEGVAKVEAQEGGPKRCVGYLLAGAGAVAAAHLACLGPMPPRMLGTHATPNAPNPGV